MGFILGSPHFGKLPNGGASHAFEVLLFICGGSQTYGPCLRGPKHYSCSTLEWWPNKEPPLRQLTINAPLYFAQCQKTVNQKWMCSYMHILPTHPPTWPPALLDYDETQALDSCQTSPAVKSHRHQCPPSKSSPTYASYLQGHLNKRSSHAQLQRHT